MELGGEKEWGKNQTHWGEKQPKRCKEEILKKSENQSNSKDLDCTTLLSSLY